MGKWDFFGKCFGNFFEEIQIADTIVYVHVL